uniref:Vacuolar protein sorting-associated protein 33A n=1 Tax=Rhabditophanes sp. KR3021 TaxID=114890 RepID=A0AC35TSE0_9BILA
MEREISPATHMQAFNLNLTSSLFNSVQGTKAVVFDQPLFRLFDSFISYTSMSQNYGIKRNLSLYNLTEVDVDHAFYFLTPNANIAKQALAHVLRIAKSKSIKGIHIRFLPEASMAITNIFKECNFTEIELTISALPIYWITLDTFSLTLCDPNVLFKNVVHNDVVSLHKCAHAISQLDIQTRNTATLRYHGEMSKIVTNILLQLRINEQKSPQKSVVKKIEINDIIIIDRFVDPITPLLIPSTFDGLIDEFFEVDSCGNVTVDTLELKDRTSLEKNEKPRIKLSLNDEYYQSIRDLHIGAVAPVISQTLKELTKQENQARDVSNSVAVYKMLVSKLNEFVKQKKSCNQYLRLVEMIFKRLSEDIIQDLLDCQTEILEGIYLGDKVIPFLECNLISGKEFLRTVRLICLQSIVNNGLKKDTLKNYQRLIVQTYGIHKLQFLIKLQMAGLLSEKNGSIKKTPSSFNFENFASTKRTFNLLPKDVVDSVGQKDASYAFNGYAPLLVRFLEKNSRVDWSDFKTKQSSQLTTNSDEEDGKKMLFVIGGLTRAESSCIKLHFKVISSTEFISGNQFINAFE